MYHRSRYANDLKCLHCEMSNRTDVWPLDGDGVPFYYEPEADNYSIEMTCPHCNNKWFVVWDYDPGPLQKLAEDVEIKKKPVGSYNGSYDDPTLYFAVKSTIEEAIKSGDHDFNEIVLQASKHMSAIYNMEKLYPLLRRAWIELHE